MERVWSLLTSPERFGDWTDARFVSADPPGLVQAGQTIRLAARFLGREWPARIDVKTLDPGKRWLDLLVHLPFGVTNDEHVTLAPWDGGTLIRLN